MIFTVAIDGPAAAGKGTIAKAIAQEFGFAQLDTGLLYRAVGKAALERGQGVITPETAVEIAKQLQPEDLTGQDLRTPRVAQAASKVAALAEVREALVTFQRTFARRPGGAVLDGRDIATVICPNAEVKLFVTATLKIRAQRRFDELTAKGLDVEFDQVLLEINARDKRDATREFAPLIAAPAALELDTSELTIEAAIGAAIAETQRKLAS